jgi:hypothetical protein
VIKLRECSIQTRQVIEDCSRAVNVRGRAKFLRQARKIDIFAVKLAVLIVKKMHVVAAVAAENMQSKASGARRGERLYNFNALPKHPQTNIEKRN